MHPGQGEVAALALTRRSPWIEAGIEPDLGLGVAGALRTGRHWRIDGDLFAAVRRHAAVISVALYRAGRAYLAVAAPPFDVLLRPCGDLARSRIAAQVPILAHDKAVVAAVAEHDAQAVEATLRKGGIGRAESRQVVGLFDIALARPEAR